MRYKERGKRIELLIFEKGFPSIRKFANYMKEKFPDDYVSEVTIANVIKGNDVRMTTMESIAKALELPLEILIEEGNTVIDDYLEREVMQKKEAYENGLRGSEGLYIDELERVKYLFDLSRRFYPRNISELLGTQQGYHITTLGELSVYMPLCKEYILADIISRIAGIVEDYENYILEQYEYLYERIPNIPAKRYADNYVIALRLSKRNVLNSEEERLLEQIEQYWGSEEFERDYEQYRKIIRQNYDLYRDDVMQCVFESRFPELYIEEIGGRASSVPLLNV